MDSLPYLHVIAPTPLRFEVTHDKVIAEERPTYTTEIPTPTFYTAKIDFSLPLTNSSKPEQTEEPLDIPASSLSTAEMLEQILKLLQSP